MNSEMIKKDMHEVEESDKALAAAFERRLDAIKVIAEYRREHGIPVPAEPDGGERAQELSAVITDAEKRPYYMSFFQGALSAS